MEACSGKVECAVAGKRVWQAAFADAHVCLPKALPLAISHVTYEGGAAGLQAGTSRTIHVNKGSNAPEGLEDLKEKVLEVDHQALKLKVKILEGGLVAALAKNAQQTVHIQEGGTPDTCVVNWCMQYEPLSEQHKPQITSTLKAGIPKGYKELEEYLLSRDDYKGL